MTLRAHTWELTVFALSWVMALGALAFVVAYLAHEAFKTRYRKERR